MALRRPLVLVGGVPTELPVSDTLPVSLTVDEFDYGDTIVPSKTPVGSVLRYLNGLLLHSDDIVEVVMEEGDFLSLVYLSSE
jgi:hypothetical protein